MASPAKCVSCFLMSNTLNVANKSTLEASAYLRRSWAATRELGRSCQTGRNSDDVQLGALPTDVSPLGMHGDGVQYTTSIRAGGAKSVYVASYNYLAGSSAARARRYVFSVLRKDGCCQRGCEGWHTLQKVFDVFAWSMGRLCSGVAPSCRHDGSPWSQEDRKHRLASGSRIPKAALIQIRGDWEWIVLLTRLRHYSAERFCWLCDALQAGPLGYRCFRPDAPHRATLVTHLRYLIECARLRQPIAAVLSCPGTTLLHIVIDCMHAGDLGSFPDALGSLFWIEMSNKAWHRNNAAGLRYLNEQLALYAQANPDIVKLRLQMTQLRSKEGYPTLKAKAAEARHAVGFALLLAARHARGDAARRPFSFRAGSRLARYSAEHRGLALRCFQGLNAFLVACDEAAFDARECRRGMYEYLQSLHELNLLWRRHLPLGEHVGQLWHLRQKCHLLQHLVEDQVHVWGSPRQFWCYGDENFVGAVKDVAARSKHPSTIERTVLKKAQLAAGLYAYNFGGALSVGLRGKRFRS